MEEKLLNEYGIEFGIEIITKKISQKMDEYRKTKDQQVEKELAILINDKEKIYKGDIETIKKYVKIKK